MDALPRVDSPSIAPAAPRVLIAFVGLAGSGKTTAAQHLVQVHGFQRVRFAGPLKDMMRALGLTEAEIEGDRKELPCDLLCGRTPRHAMRTIGTEWGRNLIGPGLWTRAWRAALDRLPAGARVVVDDCRFLNEAAAVAEAGGTLGRIVRPGVAVADHASELEQAAIDVHFEMHNTGAVSDLKRRLNGMVGSPITAQAAPRSA